MKTTALIEMGRDGTYSIFTPDLKDSAIVGGGDTIAEAKADFEISFKTVLLDFAQKKEELPQELKDVEFEYKYDKASFNKYSHKAKGNNSVKGSRSMVYA